MARKITVVKKAEKSATEKLYDLTVANIQTVGNKSFGYASLDILYADGQFQRTDDSSKAKINQLVRNWDTNKMDPLKASLHPEENRISIIDGYHRLAAATILGLPGLEIELLRNMPENPKERLIAEATYFATQGDDVDTLTPVQKHKANIIRGIKENITLDKLVTKYDIPIKRNKGGGKVAAGYLAGFSQSLKIIKTGGEDVLDSIFNILCSSRWNLETKGFSADILSALYNVMKLHPEHTSEIITETIKFFKPIKPQKYFACAMERYSERSPKEQLTLYLEDHLCDTIGMDRLYLKDKQPVRVKKGKVA